MNYEEKLKAEKDKLSEELEGLSIYKDFIQTLAVLLLFLFLLSKN